MRFSAVAEDGRQFENDTDLNLFKQLRFSAVAEDGRQGMSASDAGCGRVLRFSAVAEDGRQIQGAIRGYYWDIVAILGRR